MQKHKKTKRTHFTLDSRLWSFRQNEPIFTLCASLCPLWQKKQNEPNFRIFQQIYGSQNIYTRIPAFLFHQNEPNFAGGWKLEAGSWELGAGSFSQTEPILERIFNLINFQSTICKTNPFSTSHRTRTANFSCIFPPLPVQRHCK